MHAPIYTALNVAFAHICIMRAITKFQKHFFLVAGMDEYHYATKFHIEDKTFTEDLTNPESSKHKELLAKLIEQVRSRSCCYIIIIVLTHFLEFICFGICCGNIASYHI